MRRFLRSALAPLCLYVVLALAGHLVIWPDPAYMWFGDTGDPLLFFFFLKWVPVALSHGMNPLFSDYINYPGGVNLMWNTSAIFPAALLTPITQLAGAVLSWNLLVLLSFVASAWAAYFAVRRFVPSHSAATIGGLIYGFSPLIQAQSGGHIQIGLAFAPPLVLICIDEILIRQRGSTLNWGWALGILAAIQLLTGEEELATIAFFSVVGVVILALMFRGQIRGHVRFAAKSLGIAAGVFLAIAAYPLYFQFFGPAQLHGAIQAQDAYVTDPLNFLLPTLQWFGGPQLQSITSHFTGNAAEWNGYLGLPLAGMLLYMLFRKDTVPTLRFFAVLGATTAIFSMGPHLHLDGHNSRIPLPWWIFNNLPIAKNMLPGRFMVYVYLCAAILVAALISEWWARGPKFKQLAVGACAAILVTWFPNPSSVIASSMASPLFFSSQGDAKQIPEGSVVLIAPFSAGSYEQTAMFWQTQAGLRFRIPDGRGLFAQTRPGSNDEADPRSLGDAMIDIENGKPVPTFDTLEKMRADLLYWNVSWVVVPDSIAYRSQLIQLMTKVEGGPPAECQGAAIWTGQPSGCA